MIIKGHLYVSSGMGWAFARNPGPLFAPGQEGPGDKPPSLTPTSARANLGMGFHSMRPLRLLAWITLSFISVAVGGINWKAVWIEPTMPVSITVGETKPYTVMGLNGADVKADLTKSQYLTITSSDPEIVEVDRMNAVFVGKKHGHAEIRISFSEATGIVQAFVRERKSDSVALKH